MHTRGARTDVLCGSVLLVLTWHGTARRPSSRRQGGRMADDECIVLSDSDEEQAAPAAKRARGGASAAATADVELVDAQPAQLQAVAGADGSSDDDDEVRVVGTKGEVRVGALLRRRDAARQVARAAASGPHLSQDGGLRAPKA